MFNQVPNDDHQVPRISAPGRGNHESDLQEVS